VNVQAVAQWGAIVQVPCLSQGRTIHHRSKPATNEMPTDSAIQRIIQPSRAAFAGSGTGNVSTASV
jgi:hypothetical protein